MPRRPEPLPREGRLGAAVPLQAGRGCRAGAGRPHREDEHGLALLPRGPLARAAVGHERPRLALARHDVPQPLLRLLRRARRALRRLWPSAWRMCTLCWGQLCCMDEAQDEECALCTFAWPGQSVHGQRRGEGGRACVSGLAVSALFAFWMSDSACL